MSVYIYSKVAIKAMRAEQGPLPLPITESSKLLSFIHAVTLFVTKTEPLIYYNV